MIEVEGTGIIPPTRDGYMLEVFSNNPYYAGTYRTDVAEWYNQTTYSSIQPGQVFTGTWKLVPIIDWHGWHTHKDPIPDTVDNCIMVVEAAPYLHLNFYGCNGIWECNHNQQNLRYLKGTQIQEGFFWKLINTIHKNV